jgi:hypothetical protein
MTNPTCPICNEPMEFMYLDTHDEDQIVDVYECEDCQTAKELVAADYSDNDEDTFIQIEPDDEPDPGLMSDEDGAEPNMFEW